MGEFPPLPPASTEDWEREEEQGKGNGERETERRRGGCTFALGADNLCCRWPIYHQEDDNNMTRTQLMASRRKANLNANEKGNKEYERAAAAVVHPWTQSQELQMCMEKSRAEPPPKKVRSEEIERQRQVARLTVGLKATNTSLNPERTAADPVAHLSGNVWYEQPHQFTFIGYHGEPKNPTRSVMMGRRREQMLDDLEEGVTKAAATFKPQIQRLKLREDQDFLQGQIAMSDPNNLVRSEVLADRRADNINQLITMWGNEPPPPDNEARRATPNTRKPFWTYKPGYCEEPPKTSHKDRTEYQKWWKRVPEAYNGPAPGGETWGQGGKVDPYDRPFTKRSARSSRIMGKLTDEEEAGTLQKVDDTMQQPYKPREPPRNDIRAGNGHVEPPQYLTDDAKALLDNRAANMPMYSSFAPDHIFKDPTFRPRSHHARGKRDDMSEGNSGSQDLEGYGRHGNAPLKPAPKMRDVLMERATALVLTPTSLEFSSPTPNRVTHADMREGKKLLAKSMGKSLLHRGTKVRSSGFIPKKDRE